MSPRAAILIVCDDLLFREALRNFLLAAGYSRVDVVATLREALARLRSDGYRGVLIGLPLKLLSTRRLGRVAQRRQPEAKVLLLVSANDASTINDASFVYVIKERAFSTLLDLLAQS